MWGQVALAVGTVLAALLGSWGVVYTARASVRSKEVDVRADAYQDAHEINKGTVADLREEIARLKTDVGELRTELHETKTDAAALQRQNAILRRLLIQHVPGVNIADFITEEDR